MAISSDAGFYLVIGKAVGNAIDEVIEKIYQELQNAIERDIYSAYSPQDYARTGELVNAWRHEASGLSGEIEFEPSMLSSDQKGKPIPSRPMWDEFLAKVDSKFDKWFRSALRHQGLVVV